MKRALAFVATGLLLSNPIAGASAQCASSADQVALKTAAVQQQLMVAALSCHDVYEYNRFVLGHQSELINSDDALKAYFQKADKLHGTATYNKYKTELANAASLRVSKEGDGSGTRARRDQRSAEWSFGVHTDSVPSERNHVNLSRSRMNR